MTKRKDGKGLAESLAPSRTKSEGVLSVSMSFEGFLIESSKIRKDYAESWVYSEIKKSNSYFKKEIYSEE